MLWYLLVKLTRLPRRPKENLVNNQPVSQIPQCPQALPCLGDWCSTCITPADLLQRVPLEGVHLAVGPWQISEGKEQKTTSSSTITKSFGLMTTLRHIFSSSLIAGETINELRCCPIPRVLFRDLSTHISPVHAYEFLSRYGCSTPTPQLIYI